MDQETIEKNRKHDREYYRKNKDRFSQRKRRYYQKYKDRIKKKCCEYRELHKKYYKEYGGKYYKKHKDDIISRTKKYYQENINKIKEKKIKNRPITSAYNKKYREAHADYHQRYILAHRENRNERQRLRRKTDINYKIISALRSRIHSVLKGGKKGGSSIRELGCSLDELRVYLESKFYFNKITGEMMSWDNYGRYGWHIDHIIPLALFDLSDKDQFTKACHYTNLQPLWLDDHLKKTAEDIKNILEEKK